MKIIKIIIAIIKIMMIVFIIPAALYSMMFIGILIFLDNIDNSTYIKKRK